MALTTVKGTYKDGKVELAEHPAGVVGTSDVLVTFLAPNGAKGPANAEPSPKELRQQAGRRLIALLKEGIPLGGRPYKNREELYDRVVRFDKTRDD
jgi:hypothetical protein